MDLKTAVAGAMGALEGASFEEEEGIYYLSIPTGDEDETDSQPVLVTVYAGEDGDTIIVRSEIGPYADDIDLAEVMRWIDSSIFARVYIGGSDEEDGETLVVEAGALLRTLDGDMLAQMAQEVADVAEELGDAIYGEGEEGEDEVE
jgi:hypothetical protein